MNKPSFNPRHLQRIITDTNTLGGAGVRLPRLLPAPGLAQLDPFLLLDRSCIQVSSVYWGRETGSPSALPQPAVCY